MKRILAVRLTRAPQAAKADKKPSGALACVSLQCHSETFTKLWSSNPQPWRRYVLCAFGIRNAKICYYGFSCVGEEKRGTGKQGHHAGPG